MVQSVFVNIFSNETKCIWFSAFKMCCLHLHFGLQAYVGWLWLCQKVNNTCNHHHCSFFIPFFHLHYFISTHWMHAHDVNVSAKTICIYTCNRMPFNLYSPHLAWMPRTNQKKDNNENSMTSGTNEKARQKIHPKPDMWILCELK